MKVLFCCLILEVLVFGALLPSCKKSEIPIIVSPWAPYDFTEQEIKWLVEAAEYDEDAAHKLSMYYRGIKRDKKKQFYWERRMLELHQKGCNSDEIR
jgi:hypothetical protein